MVGAALSFLCETAMTPLNPENDPFVYWLTENLDAAHSGTATYQGAPIDRDTRVTQYHAAFSCIVLSFQFPSRFYVIGHDSTAVVAFFYTLSSLIFGWWGFPWGPGYTLGAVFGNLFGGSRQTVGDLIDELTGHRRNVVALTERAATLAREQIAERGYPPDTALHVRLTDDFHPDYRVEFDYPDSDGRQWRGESQGLTILVDKRYTHELDGLIIDCQDGRFSFRKGVARARS